MWCTNVSAAKGTVVHPDILTECVDSISFAICAVEHTHERKPRKPNAIRQHHLCKNRRKCDRIERCIEREQWNRSDQCDRSKQAEKRSWRCQRAEQLERINETEMAMRPKTTVHCQREVRVNRPMWPDKLLYCDHIPQFQSRVQRAILHEWGALLYAYIA